MLHIGILAHSADGAALCFQEMVRESARRLGAHAHPEITLSILPMGPTFAAYDKGDLAAVNVHLMRTCALDAARERYPLPGLHICDVVAERAKRDGRARVALLGTRWTMGGPAYPAAFARAGLALQAPEPDERAIVDRIIFEELCQGIISDAARAEYVRIIARMARDGCDAVALSCTEIPLLVTPEISPLPTLDSTRLLAREAIGVALGASEMPTWRGGSLE